MILVRAGEEGCRKPMGPCTLQIRWKTAGEVSSWPYDDWPGRGADGRRTGRGSVGLSPLRLTGMQDALARVGTGKWKYEHSWNT